MCANLNIDVPAGVGAPHLTHNIQFLWTICNMVLYLIPQMQQDDGNGYGYGISHLELQLSYTCSPHWIAMSIAIVAVLTHVYSSLDHCVCWAMESKMVKFTIIS